MHSFQVEKGSPEVRWTQRIFLGNCNITVKTMDSFIKHVFNEFDYECAPKAPRAMLQF